MDTKVTKEPTQQLLDLQDLKELKDLKVTLVKTALV
jgi:hypothetical protein